MFTDFNDFYKTTTDYFKFFPKTPEEIMNTLTKVQNVFEAEKANCTEMWKTYNKSIRGEASLNEVLAANKKAHELLVTARLAALLAIPGIIFALPLLVQYANEYGIDLVPASVKKEFAI